MTRVPAVAWLALLLLVTAAFYAQALGHGFTQDDPYLVQVAGIGHRANPMVATWQGLGRYFGSHYWAGIDAGGDLYRPLTILSYALTYATCGDHLIAEAFPHHLLNLLLHLLAVVLVWRLCGLHGGSLVAQVAATAVFALHPIRVEAVAGIVGRAELLGFVLGLGATLLHLQPPPAGAGRKALRSAGVAALLFLAACSKESMVVWGPLLVCCDLARGAFWLPALRAAAPPIACALVGYFALRHLALSGLPEPLPTSPIVNPCVELAGPARFGTALVLLARAQAILLWPRNLCCEYGMATFPMHASPFEGPVLLALAWHALVVTLGLIALRRVPLVFLAVAFFYGGSLVTSNALFPTGVVFAERLLYTPGLALALLALVLVRGWRTATIVLVWLVPAVIELCERVPVWRDDATLFLTDVKRNPAAVRLLTSAGTTLLAQGSARSTEAIDYLQRATRTCPGFSAAWFNLGAALARTGKLAEAEAALLQARAARYKVAHLEEPKIAGELGGVLYRLDRIDQAIPELLRAIELDADHGQAWSDLVAIAKGRHWLAEGEAQPGRAPLWHYLRGRWCSQVGSHAEAEAHFAAALRAAPGYERAVFGEADAMIAQGQAQRAAAFLESIAANANQAPDFRARARQAAQRALSR